MSRKSLLVLLVSFIAMTTAAQRSVSNYAIIAAADDADSKEQQWKSQYLQPCIPQGNSWEDKHFREALLRGRERQGRYVLINDDNKDISYDKLVDYCRKHNYTWWSKPPTKTIKKFGTTVEVIDRFYFIPDNQYIFYVYDWCDRQGISCTQLVSKGLVHYWLSGENKFFAMPDALWSGRVVDGKIDGTGAGIYHKTGTIYCYFTGTFSQGVPQGTVQYRIVDKDADYWGYTKEEAKSKFNSRNGGIDYYSVEVGDLSEGLAWFKPDAEKKYGIVANEGDLLTITKEPTYTSFTTAFHNGNATVVKGDEEIIIDRNGTFIDYTPKQKRQNQLKEEEKRKEELARRQREIENERRRQEAEKIRIEKFRKAQPGDRVYYSQDWKSSELFGWITTNYTMRVVCFVDQNVNNGERLQIRVGSVESSNDNKYSTPVIDGIKYQKGDVLWIKPFENSGWQIE